MIKKNLSLLASLLIGLCIVQNAFAQEKRDVNQEFGALRQKSEKLREGRSYRIKTTTEVFEDKTDALKSRDESVSENFPPDRFRFSTTVTTGGATMKSEFIRIGEKSYVREGDGEWKLWEPKKSVGGIGVGGRQPAKFIEETTLNGQPVKVFEESSFSSFGDESRDSTTRYWFTSEGELLKTEAREKVDKTDVYRRVVKIFEFDADIRIEAPIK